MAAFKDDVSEVPATAAETASKALLMFVALLAWAVVGVLIVLYFVNLL